MIDHALIGIGPRVRQEGVKLCRRRRQSDQVGVDSPQQDGTLRVGRENHSLRFQFGQDERVDRRANPLDVLHARQRRSNRLAECPEITIALRDVVGRGFDHRIDRGKRRTGVDPGLDERDLLGAQFRLLARGHFALVDHVEEQALVGRAGNQRRAGLAALEYARAGPQVQPRFRLFRAVALQAACGQQGQHVRLEAQRAGGRRARCQDDERREAGDSENAAIGHAFAPSD